MSSLSAVSQDVMLVIYGATEGAGVTAAFDIGRFVFNDTTLVVKEYEIQDDLNAEFFKQGDAAWWMSKITIKGIIDGNIDDVRSMLQQYQAITLVEEYTRGIKVTKMVPGVSRNNPTLRIHDWDVVMPS